MPEPADRSIDKIRDILVATDFSATAAGALDWAIQIAQSHGARLHLIHALELPVPVPDFVVPPPDLSEELQEAARLRLEQAVSELGDDMEVTPLLRIGLPSQAILEASQELESQLIIMGTRGLSGLAHLFLGSTAERVVQRAQCPVLVVHPEDVAQHRPVRTILVPTDFSHDAEVAVGAAQALLADGDGEGRMVLLHAFHLPIEYTAYGTVPTSLSYLEDFGAAAEMRLQEIAQSVRAEGFSIETRVREGYPPEVIVAEAQELHADLIAMGTRGHTGLRHLLWGSIAQRVVQKATCPVLTVRRPD